MQRVDDNEDSDGKTKKKHISFINVLTEKYDDAFTLFRSVCIEEIIIKWKVEI
jgi:hypothetical protein